MNLREAVEEVIESAMIDGWHSMEPETSLWKHNVQQQTRAAITAMREVLLSDEVVEESAKAVSSLDYEVDEIAFLPTSRDVAKAAVQAALAAAKGTEEGSA